MKQISLYTNTPKFYNDICEVIRLFLDVQKIILEENKQAGINGIYIEHHVAKQSENIYISNAAIFIDGKRAENYKIEYQQADNHPISFKRNEKSAVKRNIYFLLKKHTKKHLPWGTLTGIRPTKMLREMTSRIGADSAKDWMLNQLDVTERKFSLAKEINFNQLPTINSVKKTSLDIYIGIPFCPTICDYCSFSSTRIESGDTLQTRYVDALIKEIGAFTSSITRYDVRSIYVGGGTPTSLDDHVFERLMKYIAGFLPNVKELTVEAGRPDTITENKLVIMKRYGVDRISINPQCFSDKTLMQIGRKHTVDQFYYAFNLARKHGFKHINIDLIFGLPKERLADMKKSLKRAIKLKPESITIHTLAIKNAAKMTRETAYNAKELTMRRAVDMGRSMCEHKGYHPYYMYRQKYMMGNLENVGYCKPGYESVYNIDMMEETCSVLAFGAGAISKHVIAGENRLERYPNVKDLETYLNRIDDMIQSKKAPFSR